jgi:hypothetical protein
MLVQTALPSLLSYTSITVGCAGVDFWKIYHVRGFNMQYGHAITTGFNIN